MPPPDFYTYTGYWTHWTCWCDTLINELHRCYRRIWLFLDRARFTVSPYYLFLFWVQLHIYRTYVKSYIYLLVKKFFEAKNSKRRISQLSKLTDNCRTFIIVTLLCMCSWSRRPTQKSQSSANWRYYHYLDLIHRESSLPAAEMWVWLLELYVEWVTG